MNRTTLLPLLTQCRARLSITLPDDAIIMRAELDGQDVVVTAGEARALLVEAEKEKYDGKE